MRTGQVVKGLCLLLVQFNSDLNKPAPQADAHKPRGDNVLNSPLELSMSPPSTPRAAHARKLGLKRMSVPGTTRIVHFRGM